MRIRCPIDAANAERNHRLAQRLGVIGLCYAPGGDEPVRTDERQKSAATSKLCVEPFLPKLATYNALVVEKDRLVTLSRKPVAHRTGH